MSKRNVVLVFAVLASTAPAARADRRIFGYTYPYMTPPEGTLELEHYLDLGLNGWDDPETPEADDDWTQVDWRHQLELEYGITDHVDFGFYNVFRQPPFGSFAFDGVKLRTRWRFAEQGELGIDPAVYFEVGYFGDAVKLEEMLILSRMFDGLEISLNLKAEQEVGLESGEWEFEFLPILGIGYHFGPNVALALEYCGKLKAEGDEFEYYVSYAGPALSVAGGAFFWTIAVQPQLGTRAGSAAVQIRSLFGIFL